MRLTNKLGLPQPMYDAIARARAEYDRGESDISVTQLLSPPRMVELIRKYDDVLEEDAADNIYSLWGTVVHTMFEREERSASTEERVYLTVNGWKVGGKFDRFEPASGLLEDYKNIKVDELKFGMKVEREQQLNVLAHILRANGHTVTQLRANAILRDHSKVQAYFNPAYPKSQAALVEIPMWEPARAQAFIEERVRVHQDAHHELPLCTEEEQWKKPDKWAVMQEGRPTAIKECDWEVEAQLLVDDLTAKAAEGTRKSKYGGGFYIEQRAAMPTRCLLYCSAFAACSQGQAAVAAFTKEPS